MAAFEEIQNNLDSTLEKEVRNRTSRELQTLLAISSVGHSLKEAIKAELQIRLFKNIDDLNTTMSGVQFSVNTLEESLDKLNASTTKYNHWLICLSVIIAILTFVYTTATIGMLIKMFAK
jgi:hypothetical protein